MMNLSMDPQKAVNAYLSSKKGKTKDNSKGPRFKQRNRPKSFNTAYAVSKLDSFLVLVTRILTWLLSHTKWERYPAIGTILPYFSKLRKIAGNRGLIAMIKYHKSVRNMVTRALSGSSVVVSGISSNSKGYPKCLGPLLKYMDSPDTIKFVLTVLYSTRGLSIPNIPNFSSITSPFTGTTYDTSGIKGFWKELGLSRPLTLGSRRVAFTNYHLTTKTGPNGHGLWSSMKDLFSLPNTLINSIKVVGGKKLSSRMDLLLICKDALLSIKSLIPFPMDQGRYRKISLVPDKEEKVRVVAILDYWSQSALKPLHEDLFSILKRIPQDCTFDQGSFKTKLKPAKLYYSFDLSSATDRFPISLITEVLGCRYSKEYMTAWKDIMVGYSFDNSHAIKKEDSSLFYSVGNPMGAYSSWASFTLVHHFVIYQCCLILNIDWRYANYVLLGDDIVIGDCRIACEYQRIMKTLGVEISPLKSHISEHTYEFAKRWFHKGEEISPFPISAVVEAHSNFLALISAIDTMRSHCWKFVNETPTLVGGYYNIVSQKRRGFCRAITRRTAIALEFSSLLKVRPKCDAESVVKTLTRVLGDDRNKLNEVQVGLYLFKDCDLPWDDSVRKSYTHKLISSTVKKAFEKSFASIGTGNLPLGTLAESLVMTLTDPGFLDKINYNLDLIHCIPHLNVHGQLSEVYVRLIKEIRLINSSNSDWPLLLKGLTIPISDEIYIRREKELPYVAANALGRILEKEMIAFFEIKKNLNIKDAHQSKYWWLVSYLKDDSLIDTKVPAENPRSDPT